MRRDINAPLPNVAKALLIAGLLLVGGNALAEAIPVELKNTESGWQLLRGGGTDARMAEDRHLLKKRIAQAPPSDCNGKEAA